MMNIHDNLDYQTYSYSGGKVAEFTKDGLDYYIVAGATNRSDLPVLGLYIVRVSVEGENTELFQVYAWQGGALYDVLGKFHYEKSFNDNIPQIAARVLQTAFMHANGSKLLSRIYNDGKQKGVKAGRKEVQSGMRKLLDLEVEGSGC